MIAGLSRFVAELRREGIVVSPAEWLDALRAVRLTGIEDRDRFRAALRATLLKRARQNETFERLFNEFFAPPKRSGTRKKRSQQGSAGAGRRPGDRPMAERGRREREGDALRGLVRSARDGAVGRTGRLRRILLDERAESRAAETGEAPRGDPRRRDLRARLSFDDEREIAEAVPRVVERIRLRSGRRWRSASRGPLYLRRVFRENLAHGGVPFVLPRRRLRPRRPRVVLLVDVSWSCSRAAALFLWMACGFLRFGRETRIVLFVDRPVDASRQVERWLGRTAAAGPDAGARRPRRGRAQPGSGIAPRGRPFADLLEALPGLNLGAPSDYGRVFHQLSRETSRWCGRDTLLVILGDGRNNRLASLDWALGEVAERCAATLWLVPESLREWGSGDSALADYLPHVDVAVEARDLDGLGRGVSELMRRF